MRILVTGGAGYIGSHTCIELLGAGHEVVIVDNLVNAKPEAVARIREISGRAVDFHQVDLLDEASLEQIFAAAPVDAVIHFAALKAVGESVEKPLEYYHNNLTGTLVLLKVMRKHGVKQMVFSSSATTYGEQNIPPLREDMPRGSATNPYGQTKVIIEQILEDLHLADPTWRIAMLRYFNPVGAHATGRIGEDPNGVPNNLFPFVTQVLVGRLPYLKVFGSDYDTPDGTPVRDYIHVTDLAIGHLKALEKLAAGPGVRIYNLGTGRGNTVLEVIQAFERATGRKVAHELAPRRAGDLPVSYADPAKAERELGWKAQRSLDEMCADAWRWQEQNPKGFE